jgi:hypothetical protein
VALLPRGLVGLPEQVRKRLGGRIGESSGRALSQKEA